MAEKPKGKMSPVQHEDKPKGYPPNIRQDTAGILQALLICYRITCLHKSSICNFENSMWESLLMSYELLPHDSGKSERYLFLNVARLYTFFNVYLVFNTL